MLRELLLETDKEKMDIYRENYALISSETKDKSPLYDILHYWEEAKEDLFHLLGDQFIIKKDFEYSVGEVELERKFSSMLSTWDPKSYGRENRTAATFKKAYLDWARALPENIRWNMTNLLEPYWLARGEYDGIEITISLNDKPYTLHKGQKIMRILSKIAAAYNIPGFEDFRICHSLELNQRKLSGKLVLSIHPLDYWTMSDNDSDWSSCMSWQETGGFRQGTVEMMNSPYVVVAYLEGDGDFRLNYKTTWNNKRWRQLFIVDKSIIIGIKSYPYHNDSITQTALAWLKELAIKNMGWEYADSLYELRGRDIVNKEGTQIITTADFYTRMMYCDFSSANHPDCYVAPTAKDITINYSGVSECVWCGNTSDVVRLSKAEALVCDECENCNRCAECGKAIYEDDSYYYFNDQYYCEDCVDEVANWCVLCGDYTLKENTTAIKILIEKQDEEIIIFDEENYICNDCISYFKKELANGAEVFKDDEGILYFWAQDVNVSSPLLPNQLYQKFTGITPTYTIPQYLLDTINVDKLYRLEDF